MTRLGLAGLSEYPQSREWQGLGGLAQEAGGGAIYETGWYTTPGDEWWWFDAPTQSWDYWGAGGEVQEPVSVVQSLTAPVADPVYGSGTGWYYEDSTASWWWLDAPSGVWTDYGVEVADTGTDWTAVFAAIKAGLATTGQLSTVLQQYGVLPKSGQQYRINPTTRRAEIYDPVTGTWKVASPVSPTGGTAGGLFGNISPTVLLIGGAALLFILMRRRG